jgi:hypothetical protein
MPNLTEGWAIVIAAGISVGGMALTQFFNWLQRKADFTDKYFFDAYNRRLAVYEDVIRELGALGKPEETLVQMSAGDFSTKLMQAVHTLNGLLVRLDLYGSPGSRGRINVLYVELSGMISSEPPANLLGKEADAGAFLANVEQARIDFTDFVTGEAGQDIVNEKIMKAAKKFTKRAKRVKQQTNKLDRKKYSPD